MNTSTVRHESPTAISLDATITHQGHDFTANGGYVSSDLVYAYVKPDGDCNGWQTMGTLTLWDGTEIGRYETRSTWKQYSSVTGRYIMRSIRARINYGPAQGTYHGRYNEDWSQLVTLRPYRKEA